MRRRRSGVLARGSSLPQPAEGRQTGPQSPKQPSRARLHRWLVVGSGPYTECGEATVLYRKRGSSFCCCSIEIHNSGLRLDMAFLSGRPERKECRSKGAREEMLIRETH